MTISELIRLLASAPALVSAFEPIVALFVQWVKDLRAGKELSSEDVKKALAEAHDLTQKNLDALPGIFRVNDAIIDSKLR